VEYQHRRDAQSSKVAVGEVAGLVMSRLAA